MDSAPQGGPVRVNYALGERIVMGGLGLVAASGGGALALLLLYLGFERWHPVRTPLLAAFAALLGACAWVGGRLVRRAVTGSVELSARSVQRDRELRDPASLRGLALAMTGALVVFLASGATPWGGGATVASASVWYFLLSPLWLLPRAVAHELGHALLARLVGLRLESLRFGPVEVSWREGRPRLALHSEGLGGILGFAKLDVEQAAPSPGRYAVMLLGGPLAEAMLCSALVGLLLLTGAAPPEGAQGGPALLWAAALAFALGALLNLVPLRTRSGAVSDGGQLLFVARALRSRAGALLFQTGIESARRRPREWSAAPARLEEAALAAHGPADIRGQLGLLALAMHLDRAEFDTARGLLARLTGGAADFSGPVRMELALQEALLQALALNDPLAARSAWARAGAPPPALPFYARLSEAAVLLAEGRRDEASHALDAWERGATGSGVRAQLEVGNLWALELLRERLAGPREPVPAVAG
jgi:hypothetical protein